MNLSKDEIRLIEEFLFYMTRMLYWNMTATNFYSDNRKEINLFLEKAKK